MDYVQLLREYRTEEIIPACDPRFQIVSSNMCSAQFVYLRDGLAAENNK